MEKRRYRVVQWATGNIGLRSLRTVIEHPDMELVGLVVFSDAKVGKDAGELCGLEPVGVPAARPNIEAVLALEPDCVLYMANHTDDEVLCRLLESGVNVVSSAGELHRRESIEPERRRRIEEACRRGGSSIHATGSSPGFITENVPLAMVSILRRLDCITIDEYADMSSRNSPEMIFGAFGGDPASFDRQRIEGPAQGIYGGLGAGPSFHLIADAMSVPLDEVVTVGEVAAALDDVEIAAGSIKAGTVAARRSETVGVRNGQPLLRFRRTLYLSNDVEPDFELHQAPKPAGWRMRVDGDSPLDITIAFPVPEENWGEMSPGLTAHPPVNAVPYVCEAEPGIRTTVNLPRIIPNFGP
jgi:4-hydroxy-tetrahydrodipicolinate reductase